MTTSLDIETLLADLDKLLELGIDLGAMAHHLGSDALGRRSSEAHEAYAAALEAEKTYLDAKEEFQKKLRAIFATAHRTTVVVSGQDPGTASGPAQQESLHVGPRNPMAPDFVPSRGSNEKDDA